jgi:hypothetical protein
MTRPPGAPDRASPVAPETARPRTFGEILDRLYEGSWNRDIERHRSPFAFRGLPRGSEDHASGLSRLLGARRDVAKLEVSMLRNFRKYAVQQTAYPLDSIWHWLALAQHHGLPTRLLDWTFSPLVALHFATESAVDEGDGLVLCVDFVHANKLLPERLRTILEEEGSDTFTAEMLSGFATLRDFDALSREAFLLFLEPPALDARIMNQAALFSLMPSPTASLSEWLAAHPDLCRKVILPAELKWEVRDKLDQANITERTLFPGLDGLSRSLARYYRPRPDASGKTR